MSDKIYLFLIAALTPILLHGTPSSFPKKELFVKKLSLEEGLSQSMTTMVYRDELGLAWIGTGGGLHYFDGNKFSVFRHQISNDKSIPDNVVRDMLPLGNKKYLLTTASAISLFNRTKNTFTTLVKGVQSEPVSMKISRGDKYLFWTKECGYFWIKENKVIPIKQHKKNALAQNSNFIPHKALKIEENKLLIAGYQNFVEIWFHNDYELEIIEYPVVAKQLHIAQNPNGKVFFTGENAVFEYKGNGKLEHVFSSPIEITSAFFIDSKGVVWQADAQKKKLFKRTVQGNWVELSLSVKEGKFSEKIEPYIKFIFEDESDCLWFGTDGHGIILYKPHSFYFKKSELGFTTSITSTDNFIWTGTWQDGLFRLSHQLDRKQKMTNKTISEKTHILHLASDRQNRVWTITPSGLSVISENGKEFFVHSFKTISGRIWQIAEDTMLVSVPGNVYFYSFSDNKITFENSKQSFFINDLAQTDNGYWMCSRNGVFFGLQPIASEATQITQNPSFRIIEIGEEIWVSETSRILVFSKKGEEKKSYEYPTHLPDAKTYGILYDEKNNDLWFSTEKGIFKMNISTEQVYSFGKEYDLQSLEFNSTAFHQTKQGQFIYGGIKGLNSFFPEDYNYHVTIKKEYIPVLTNLTIQKKEGNIEVNLHTDKPEIKLPYTNFGFFGTVGIGDYERNKLHKFSFFLENYNQEWNIQDGEGDFSFGKLPPGNYTLTVKYRNSYGNWSNSVNLLSVYVAYPFWMKTWFIVTSFLLLIVVTLVLLKYFQYRKLKKIIDNLKHKNTINQERLRIARDLHDEIGTELSYISMLARKPTDNVELQNIATKSQTLLENLKHVIWIADPEYDCLDDMQAVVREYIGEFAEKSSWKYYFENWENNSSFEVDSITKRNLFLTIKECLHNSKKHSGADAIFISWVYLGAELHFSYTDNGSGLDEARQTSKKGRGLKNIQKRAEDSKGKVYFSNHSKHGGLHIQFIIPVKPIMQT